jgi:hypothetical protein
VWCPPPAAEEPLRRSLFDRKVQLRDTRRVPATTQDSFCCFWSPVADKCKSCPSKASGSDWCAQSQTNCQGCQGTWCSGGAGSTSPSAAPPAAPTSTAVQQNPQTSAPSLAPISTTQAIATSAPSTSAAAPAGTASTTGGNWVEGTYVTGYWDCCKPSCSWTGKGSVTAPVRACKPDGSRADPADVSVCLGGVAGSCPDNQPWVLNDMTSLGFTAAAVSGGYGLTGDANCGQCYQLVFTSQVHADGNWGGCSASIVGKSHIVQITNIGYDVSGAHTFDLQIPGAGQGAFTSGCTRQFGGKSGDYDCDNSYGGCNDASGCARLPASLRAGCQWRYSWFKWLVDNGKSNNPYVKFRRVKCPKQLTDISGSIPLDDDKYPVVV